jgi:hypothetical protein
MQLVDRSGARFAQDSRAALFETLERPALRALPKDRYEFATWRKAKLNIDYHVEVRADRHYYSVPYRLVGETLEVRLSAGAVEVFPFLEGVSLMRTYLGFRPYCPDHLPIVGPDPRAPVRSCQPVLGHRGVEPSLLDAARADALQARRGRGERAPLQDLSSVGAGAALLSVAGELDVVPRHLHVLERRADHLGVGEDPMTLGAESGEDERPLVSEPVDPFDLQRHMIIDNLRHRLRYHPSGSGRRSYPSRVITAWRSK